MYDNNNNENSPEMGAALFSKTAREGNDFDVPTGGNSQTCYYLAVSRNLGQRHSLHISVQCQ